MHSSKKSRHTLINKLEYVLLYAFYIVLITALINSIIAVIWYFFDQEIKYENFQYAINNISLLKQDQFIKTVIGILIVSALEEILFRLPLKETTRNIPVSIFAGILWLIYSFLIPIKYLGFVLITYISFLTFVYFYSKTKRINPTLLLWVSVIIAGLSQIRYVIIYNAENWPLYLMLFSLMFVKSFYLAKTRMKLGIYYSYGLNLIFSVVPMLNYLFNS